jgi:arylsulfatase A-like enzyme
MKIFSLLFGCFMLFFSGSHNARVTQKPQLPNVLMICVDDMNDFIGGLGHPDAITPNIDKLMKRGLIFSNAHCQAPMCGPSRAALMSGLRPSTTGIYGMIPDDAIKEASAANRKSALLQEYFQIKGYYTMGIGKIFHEHAPEGFFDESGGREKGFGPVPPQRLNWHNKGTSTDWGAFPERDDQMPDYRSAQWAMERLKRTYEKPFFLSVGFLRPHVPWLVPQKWLDLYDTAKTQLPPYLKTDRNDLSPIALRVDDWPMMPTTEWAIANKQWKNMLQSYLASVSFVDHYVGEILNTLESSPHAKNTVVVLWSDHGYRLGEKNTFAKMCLWDRATRSPLIFAGPGIPHNTRVDAPVELFSVYPTLTDICGLPANPHLEARSLSPLIKNPKAAWGYPAITTWGRNNHAIKTKDYRYIRYEDGSEELYVVKSDPNEWHNVAAERKYAPVKERLRKQLPTTNVEWAKASKYDMNEYFKQQKLEQTETDF